MKSQIFPNRVFWRLDLVTRLSHEFKPRANSLASLGLLSCSATAGAMLQLLACLAHVHHSGGLQPWATHEIQPRVPASLHKLEQFFTLSYTLPLHDSHLNTRLQIAKIQANFSVFVKIKYFPKTPKTLKDLFVFKSTKIEHVKTHFNKYNHTNEYGIHWT